MFLVSSEVLGQEQMYFHGKVISGRTVFFFLKLILSWSKRRERETEDEENMVAHVKNCYHSSQKFTVLYKSVHTKVQE